MRFRKSIKVAPGVKVNLNKSSISVTTGTKGLHHTVSSNGSRTTSAGILGTGVSYAKTTRSSSSNSKKSTTDDPGMVENGSSITPDGGEPKKKKRGCCIYPFAIIFIFGIIGMIFGGGDNNPQKPNITPTPTVIATTTPTVTPEPTVTPTPEPTATPIPEPTPTPEPVQNLEETTPAESVVPQEEMVWIPASGSKYHSNSSCSGMNGPTQVTISEAQSMGYEPCKRCY